jgi:hypothetical protein
MDKLIASGLLQEGTGAITFKRIKSLILVQNRKRDVWLRTVRKLPLLVQFFVWLLPGVPILW